jgi:hypothetical protein
MPRKKHKAEPKNSSSAEKAAVRAEELSSDQVNDLIENILQLATTLLRPDAVIGTLEAFGYDPFFTLNMLLAEMECVREKSKDDTPKIADYRKSLLNANQEHLSLHYNVAVTKREINVPTGPAVVDDATEVKLDCTPDYGSEEDRADFPDAGADGSGFGDGVDGDEAGAATEMRENNGTQVNMVAGLEVEIGTFVMGADLSVPSVDS